MTWDPSLWDGRTRPVRDRLDDHPLPTDMIEVLEQPAARTPEAPAIKFVMGRESLVVSYRQLWDRVRGRATQLRRLGIDAGDRVVLALDNGPGFVELFYGAVLLGALPVPVSPPTSRRPEALQLYFGTLQALFADSGAVALAMDGRALVVVRQVLGAAAPTLIDPADKVDDPLPADAFPRPAPEDIAYLQYTSGSTSAPKGVRIRHRNVMANNRCMMELSFDTGTILTSWLPLFHDMGLAGMLMTALYARVPIVLMRPLDFLRRPACWIEEMSRHRATLTTAPNFAFGFLSHRTEISDLDGVDLSCVRTMFNGAEPIDKAAMDAFHARFAAVGLPPDVVRAAYGLAEATLAVAWSPPGPLPAERIDRDRLEREGFASPSGGAGRTRVVVSCGPAVPRHEVKIVGRDGARLPDRHVGEICFKGPSVTAGYHKRPEETARVYQGDWLHTGDLGYLAGGNLTIVGRLKDILIRHGRNYYPEDLEYHAGCVEGVRPGCVAAFSASAESDEEVVLVAETRVEDTEGLKQLVRQVRSRWIDAFGFGPDHVVLVPPQTVPKTTSGKVKRKLTQKRWMKGMIKAISAQEAQ